MHNLQSSLIATFQIQEKTGEVFISLAGTVAYKAVCVYAGDLYVCMLVC